MERTHSTWTKPVLAALLPTLLLVAAAICLLLAMPAQAYAEPDNSKVYTIGDAAYRPHKDSDGAWYAVAMTCKGSSSVTIAENVKIEGVTMPVTGIFPGAFMQKDNLKTLTIKAKIDNIPHTMCSNCPKLEKVVVPATVTEIGEHAFYNCESLNSISDLINVESIKKYAFENCRSLTSIKTVKLHGMGTGAFKDCVKLQAIADNANSNANKTLVRINPYTFYNCMSLAYIGSLENIRTVGDYAFWKCHSLPSVEFFELTSIGECAFQNCTSLVSVDLGSAETIGANAFENCVSLKNLMFSGEEQRIEAGAFKGCEQLKHVFLPASLEFLGVAAFMNCISMTEFVIPSPGNMTYVPSNVCKGCKALKSVRIPLSITDNIGSDAFENSGLKQVYVLHKDVIFNGNPFKGCTGLTMIGWSVSTANAFADAHDDIGWISLNDPNSSLEKVDIVFHRGSGDGGGGMEGVKVPLGSDYILPECGYTWSGHVFAGWKSEGRIYQAGDVYEDVEGTVDSDGVRYISFSAQWDKAFKVTLKGIGGSDKVIYYPDPTLDYTIPTAPPSGSTTLFKDWYVSGTDYSDPANHYQPGDHYGALTGDLTLIAQWITPKTVRLDAHGGKFSDGTSTKELKTNKGGKLDAFPEVSYEGFDFYRWEVYDSNSHTYVAVSEDTVLDRAEYMTDTGSEKVINLLAQWKPGTKREVILDPNGGTVAGSDALIWLTTDDTGFLTDNTILAYTPIRPHYTFAGWVFDSGDKIVPGFYHYYRADTIVAAVWEPIMVTKVALSKTSATLTKGETLALTAMVTPSDALDTSVKWSSSNAAVASVSAAGVVTAVAPGTAVITCASTDGGAKATCEVTVGSGLAPDGTAVGAGAAASAAEEFLTSYNKEADPAGSTFAKLRLKASKVGKNSVTLTWKKVGGAAKYVVYGTQCGKKKLVKVATLGAGKAKYTWKKLSGKKLAQGKYHKAVVVAVGADGKVLGTSKMVHAATTGGKVGNHVKVTTKAKKGKITLKKGKTFKLAGKAVAGSKKVKLHRKAAVSYESSNKAVASVSKKGVVKAKKPGACIVYAYAQNGVFAKVKVVVKGKGTVGTQSVESAPDGEPLRAASIG